MRRVVAQYSAPLQLQNPMTLSLYDRKGDFIKKLWDGDHALGEVTDITWDGRNDKGSIVASGTYILVLKAGDIKQTKKIVVIK